MKPRKMLFALMLVGLATSLTAQTGPTQGNSRQPPGGQGGGGGDGQHPGPPPEAIAACKDKASGATCSFVGRQGKPLTGTCFAPPSGGGQGQSGTSSAPAQGNHPPACRPDRGGPGGNPNQGGQSQTPRK